MLRIREKLDSKQEASRKFAAKPSSNVQMRWDAKEYMERLNVGMSNIDTYEQLIDHIRSAAAASSKATSKEDKISTNTRALLKKRLQAIQTGSEDSNELLAIKKEARKALEEDIRRWNEKKSLEAAEEGRSVKKVRRKILLKDTPFSCLTKNDDSITHNRVEIRNEVLKHYTDMYAPWPATSRTPQTQTLVPDERPILQSEVEAAIKSSKTHTAPGADKITMWMLKTAIDTIAPTITRFFNEMLGNGILPKEWKNINVALIPKKCNPKRVKDYRPIAMASVVSKVFTKILTRRILTRSESYLEESQAGFRRGRSCVDNIHTLAQLWERSNEYKMPLVAVFLYFSCAFDNVKWQKITEVLQKIQVGRNVWEALENANLRATGTLVIHGKNMKFPIMRGVRQGYSSFSLWRYSQYWTNSIRPCQPTLTWPTMTIRRERWTNYRSDGWSSPMIWSSSPRRLRRKPRKKLSHFLVDARSTA